MAAFELGRNTNAKIKMIEAAATVRTLDWKECIIASEDGALLLDRTALSNGTSSRAVPIRKFALEGKVMLTANYWLWHRSPFLVMFLTKGAGKDCSVGRSGQ